MKDKAKIFVITFAVIALLCCYSARVVYINKNAKKSETEIFGQGEFVDLGDNYFYNSGEQLDGYSVKVESAKLMTLENFINSFGRSFDEYKKQAEDDNVYLNRYVVCVELTIKNSHSQGYGIDIISSRVCTVNYNLECNAYLFSYIYPDFEEYTYLKVREGTEFRIALPYLLIPSYEEILGEKDLINADLYLNLTQYPIKKMIKLNVCDMVV